MPEIFDHRKFKRVLNSCFSEDQLAPGPEPGRELPRTPAQELAVRMDYKDTRNPANIYKYMNGDTIPKLDWILRAAYCMNDIHPYFIMSDDVIKIVYSGIERHLKAAEYKEEVMAVIWGDLVCPIDTDDGVERYVITDPVLDPVLPHGTIIKLVHDNVIKPDELFFVEKVDQERLVRYIYQDGNSLVLQGPKDKKGQCETKVIKAGDVSRIRRVEIIR